VSESSVTLHWSVMVGPSWVSLKAPIFTTANWSTAFSKARLCRETFSESLARFDTEPCLPRQAQSIYTSPAYQDWRESHPLRQKKLKKEIIDAWVEGWRRMILSKPTERSIIADIISLLPQLSEDGLRRVQAEMNIALSMCDRK
jgi:hypothetical protein